MTTRKLTLLVSIGESRTVCLFTDILLLLESITVISVVIGIVTVGKVSSLNSSTVFDHPDVLVIESDSVDENGHESLYLILLFSGKAAVVAAVLIFVLPHLVHYSLFPSLQVVVPLL